MISIGKPVPCPRGFSEESVVEGSCFRSTERLFLNPNHAPRRDVAECGKGGRNDRRQVLNLIGTGNKQEYRYPSIGESLLVLYTLVGGYQHIEIAFRQR